MRTLPLRHAVASMVWCLAGALGLTSATAHAEISGASGRVEASVKQLNATTGQIVDQAFEQTPGTTNILPAEATVILDVAGLVHVQGRLTATATVSPPETVTATTKDFNCEAAGLSLLAENGFASDAKSIEDRQIVFLASELDLTSGTPIRIRSTFSLSAGVFLVTLPGSSNDVAGSFSFTIHQTRSGTSQVLLTGTGRVFFDASGLLQITTTGAASQAITVPFDFTDASGELNQARMIVFPLISLPYEYDATVDEAFTLTAEVSTSTGATTGNQGGSAFIGQVPTSFTQTLDEFLALDLTTSVGGLIGPSAAQKVALQDDNGTQIVPLTRSACGNFGFEALLGGLALTLTFVRRRQ